MMLEILIHVLENTGQLSITKDYVAPGVNADKVEKPGTDSYYAMNHSLCV